jgi:hypothetical protein
MDPKAAQALALLALVAGQDVEPADGSDGTDGRWRIARKVAEDRVISTVDTEARRVHKSVHHRQDGYKAHLAVEPDTGLVVAAELTKACGEDNHEAVVGLTLLDNDITAGAGADTGAEPGGFEVLADAAYGTGDTRAALEEAGHTAIIKPPPLRPHNQGRIHPRRLHPRRVGRHGHLPKRGDPTHHRPPEGHLRGRLPRLPAAVTMHHPHRRPVAVPAPA